MPGVKLDCYTVTGKHWEYTHHSHKRPCMEITCAISHKGDRQVEYISDDAKEQSQSFSVMRVSSSGSWSIFHKCYGDEQVGNLVTFLNGCLKIRWDNEWRILLTDKWWNLIVVKGVTPPDGLYGITLVLRKEPYGKPKCL
tara:strand:+ start:64 stop:483 length:420 start_codon:yes stop_codon:yes gene_type:complete